MRAIVAAPSRRARRSANPAASDACLSERLSGFRGSADDVSSTKTRTGRTACSALVDRSLPPSPFGSRHVRACSPRTIRRAPSGSFRSAPAAGDIFTRALADELQKALRQPVVVENRTGGALNIGTRACAEAPLDGYTICVLSSEPVIYNQFLFKSLPFDPDKDFAPISNLFSNTLALVANNSLKVRTIPDLVALAKARPGTLSYGTFSFRLRISWRKDGRRYRVCRSGAAAKWSPPSCRARLWLPFSRCPTWSRSCRAATSWRSS